MKPKILGGICLFVIVIIGVFYFQIDSKEKATIHLKFKKSFPDKKAGFFFQYPNMFSKDEAGNFFINDQPRSHIIKVDSAGEFIKFIGNKGRGPGEFNRQSRFTYGNHKIYVWDQGNLRLQVVNDNGEFLNSIPFNNILSSLTYHNNKIYSFTLNRDLTNFQKEGLISVFDTLGNKLQEFGDYLNIIDNMAPEASKPILKFYDNKLYVLFHFYPILQVYNEEGKLLETLNLEKESYKSSVPQNYDSKSFSTPGVSGTKYLFRAMDVNEEGIFLGLHRPHLVIDKYDFDGNYKIRYEYDDVQDNYYLFDFIAEKEKNDRLKFTVLNRNKLSTITVYTAPK